MTVMDLTAGDLIRAVSDLPRNREYGYVSSRNRGRIVIGEIEQPEGPIYFQRYNPTQGESLSGAARETISRPMLWRLANALRSGVPVNLDHVFSGSYNTRSVLEALLAHTAQFYVCRPSRVEAHASIQTVRRGHKHLVWKPDAPHPLGEITTAETDIIISEQIVESVYEGFSLSAGASAVAEIGAQRRHAQIQIALIHIGRALGCRSYIARNDQGIRYKDAPIAELEGVVSDLRDIPLVAGFPGAPTAGALIDCVWFRNARFMPAVMEIEHSTGVTSGLTRMKKFQDTLPPLDTRFIIVAPDEDRSQVISRCEHEVFRELKPRYLPYQAVEELYSLVSRRKLQGVSDRFIDSFLESPST